MCTNLQRFVLRKKILINKFVCCSEFIHVGLKVEINYYLQNSHTNNNNKFGVLTLSGAEPGNFTLSPVPKDSTLKPFLARKACASMLRFMLLEQITAIFMSSCKPILLPISEITRKNNWIIGTFNPLSFNKYSWIDQQHDITLFWRVITLTFDLYQIIIYYDKIMTKLLLSNEFDCWVWNLALFKFNDEPVVHYDRISR